MPGSPCALPPCPCPGCCSRSRSAPGQSWPRTLGCVRALISAQPALPHLSLPVLSAKTSPLTKLYALPLSLTHVLPSSNKLLTALLLFCFVFCLKQLLESWVLLCDQKLLFYCLILILTPAESLRSSEQPHGPPSCSQASEFGHSLSRQKELVGFLSNMAWYKLLLLYPSCNFCF